MGTSLEDSGRVYFIFIFLSGGEKGIRCLVMRDKDPNLEKKTKS
jgi:hypothetical protein